MVAFGNCACSKLHMSSFWFASDAPVEFQAEVKLAAGAETKTSTFSG